MERFGKYSVVARLGVGGMAELYKCRLTGPGGFDKFVAVKRVLPERAEEPEFINMFLDEARLAANLTHPNIVQIYEIDEEEGVPYIAMEYVRGPTFRALSREAWKQSKVHYGHLARIIADVCEGLDYAHQATTSDGTPMQLVHRDVSPQNIIVGMGGLPKLVDFGVAKAAGRLASTDAGTIKGKLKYMAPEQLRGEQIDFRADVFSAGVCLFEATTGSSPFAPGSASELELLQAVLRGNYRKPSEIVPGFPGALEKAILWAIEPDLAKRCESARDLHDALAEFASTGEYASSVPKLAAWVRQLFPNGEDARFETRTNVKTPTSAKFTGPSLFGKGATTPSRGRRTKEEPNSDFHITTEIPGRRQRIAMLVGGGALLIGVALGGAFWLGKSRPVANLPPIAKLVPPASPPPPVVSGDQGAIAYMDEAQRNAAQHRFGLALELLGKAHGLKVESPTVNIRLSTLTEDIGLQASLFKARKLLDTGQTSQALESIKQALDHSPENAEALELLGRAHKAASGATDSHKAQASAARGRSGTLSVLSQPTGGIVFVDDEMMGRTPLVLRTVPSGPHHIQIRMRGFVPVEREIPVRSGKSASVSVALVSEQSMPPPTFEAEPAETRESASAGAHAGSVRTTPTTTLPAEPASEAKPGPPIASLSSVPPAGPASSPSPPSAPTLSLARGGQVLPPRLPTVYSVNDERDLRRVLALIESEASAQGRVGSMANGVTRSLADEIVSSSGNDVQGAKVYPVAIYYFLVREAALGKSRDQTAAELKAVHQNQNLLKLRDLPHVEAKLPPP